MYPNIFHFTGDQASEQLQISSSYPRSPLTAVLSQWIN